MRTFNVILNGARAVQGTSTIAAALALYAGRSFTTLVATTWPRRGAAWTSETAGRETPTTDRLTLVGERIRNPTVLSRRGPSSALVDVAYDLRLVVLRGPCYVALRSLVLAARAPAGMMVL